MLKPAIVCVDDDLLILNSLGEQLSRSLSEEYDIELVTSPSAALEIFSELVSEGIEIPLIISDQGMPEMSGNELLTQIHAQYPHTLTIMLTGQINVDDVAKAVNSGNLYRYIAKPWDETDLILTVKEALRRYAQEQQLTAQSQALRQANEDLEKSLSLLRATLESTADGILVVDSLGNVTHFNQKLLDIWGMMDEVALNGHKNQVLAAIEQQLPDSDPFNHKIREWEQPCSLESYDILTLKNGKIIECYSQIQCLGSQNVGRVWSFQDITERRQTEEIIHYQAHHDCLTGLPNRKQFNERLSQLLAYAHQRQEPLGVLFIDLDHFKVVNDTLGHVLGDRLLQQVVDRLNQCCRSEDMIARWGGDEFTMALPHIHSREDATAIAQRILEALHPSFELEEHQIRISSSIGISIYPEDGSDADTLLKNADTALYQAKELGRNDYQHYAQALNSQSTQRLALENSLYQALERRELLVYYQPQLDSTTGEITHMEALVRWQHPQLGFISPEVFIPLAEQNGLIIQIGKWVLQTACTQAKAWQVMGMPPMTIAVNLSPRQLKHRQLLQTIKHTLTEIGLEPHYLELEITESATLQDVDSTRSILTDLQSMGISIALDDFGTGYSSLSYLKQFPFHSLKIDQSFVRDLLTNHQDVAIVEALLALGRGLNIRVIAEGVETVELKNLLETLGCYYMQGYYFSRPLPSEEATKVLMLKGSKVGSRE
ncbi:EAL domain-containing response regulator [Merismopedia glauca]|uniref:Diguanylate cyclase n=1 Tax=Merismopedia glauca CCAP 1448/3 TaxID=1296344 RepID=A0A2T1C765_9CYAN|nr:EAL domain-containing protein [Merismopedia glauca]PSB04074.1 diguanylate cyclase [Merismopedia glauca CCAP 1448/3]